MFEIVYEKEIFNINYFFGILFIIFEKKSCDVKYRVQINMLLIFFILYVKIIIIFCFIILILYVKIVDFIFVKNIEVLIIF